MPGIGYQFRSADRARGLSPETESTIDRNRASAARSPPRISTPEKEPRNSISPRSSASAQTRNRPRIPPTQPHGRNGLLPQWLNTRLPVHTDSLLRSKPPVHEKSKLQHWNLEAPLHRLKLGFQGFSQAKC